MKITCKTILIPPIPVVPATRIGIEIAAESLAWQFRGYELADDSESLVISWGDGTKETLTERTKTTVAHTYAEPGWYTVELSDDLAMLKLSAKLQSYVQTYAPKVRSFATNATKLKTFDTQCFYSCDLMTDIQLNEAHVERLRKEVFYDCALIGPSISLPHVRELDVDGADGHPFQRCPNLREIHFSALNAEEIRNSVTYQTDPTLGSGTAQVFFDL